MNTRITSFLSLIAVRFLSKIGLLAIAVTLVPLSWGKPPVQWVPGEISYTIGDGQGTSEPVVATFESSVPLENVAFFVAPELRPFVSVDAGGLTSVLPNTPYSVNLRFSIPPGTRPGLYTGVLCVRQRAFGLARDACGHGLSAFERLRRGEQAKYRPPFVNCKELFREGCGPLAEALKVAVKVSYGKNVVGPATTVLSGQTVQLLTSISADRSTLTFSQTTSELTSLRVGRILILGDTATSPGGFIGRITKVSRNGSDVVVTSAPASLAEAFKSLDISISRALSPGDVATQIPTSPSALRPQVAIASTVKPMALAATPMQADSPEFFLALNHVLLYDAGGGAQVWADGSLSFSPSFTFNCSIQNFALQQLRFVDTSTFTTNLSVTAELQASLSKSVTLADYPLTPITIWAGYVPIVITPHLLAKAGIDGSVSIGLTAAATQTATLTAGLQFSNGAWQPVSQFSNSFTFQPPQPSAAASVDAYAGPELDLLIYDVAGPYVEVNPNLELDINPLAEPQYQLYGGLNVPAGVKLQVLDQLIADYENPAVISYRVLLMSGDFPKPQFRYIVTDLGSTDSIHSESIAAHVNDSGQVVGTSWSLASFSPGTSGDGRAFLYSGGTMIDIGMLASGSFAIPSAGAFGINSSGQIVGLSTANGFDEIEAFLYTGAVMTGLGTLPSSPDLKFSDAFAINDSGQVVGEAFSAIGSVETVDAFLYSGGVMTDIITNADAVAINNGGQIVGQLYAPSSFRHAFIYSAGVTRDLGTLGADVSSWALSINASGQVVGISYTAIDGFGNPLAPHAFLYSSGAMINIGDLGGGSAWAEGINDSGQIVGQSTSSGGIVHAFVYFRGVMVDVNSLVDMQSSAFVLLDKAAGINNKGQIAGTGTTKSGHTHAFLLTPAY